MVKGIEECGNRIQTYHSDSAHICDYDDLNRENLGWVQKMMGHASLKMITDKYFSFIPNMTHQDGSKFLEEYEKKVEKGVVVSG